MRRLAAIAAGLVLALGMLVSAPRTTNAIASACDALTGNLITTNCGMEQIGTWSPWVFTTDSYSATLLGRTASAATGSWAMNIGSSPNDVALAGLSEIGVTVPTTPNAMYRFEFWVKGGGTNASRVYATYRDGGTGSNLLNLHLTQVANWTQVVTTFVPTQTTTWVGFRFQTDIDTFYNFDDVSILAQPVVSGLTATRAKGQIAFHFTEQAGVTYQCQLKPSDGWYVDCHNLDSYKSSVKQVSVKASRDDGWTYGLPTTVTVTRG